MVQPLKFPWVSGFLCALILAGSCSEAAASTDEPVITTQPQPQTAFAGANINLHVAATSSLPFRYWWRFNGTNLPKDFPGQFTPLLMLREVTPAAAGPYSVVVSNSFGSATSQTAMVTVNEFAGLVIGYVNLTAAPGYSLFTAPLAYPYGTSGTNQTIADQIPATVDGGSVFKVDGNGFIANNFLDGWSDPGMILTLGEGWFFHNPTPEPFTLTFIGAVMEGRLINRLPTGFSACAGLLPQAGLVSSELAFPFTPGAEVFFLDGPSQSYQSYAAGPTGWEPFEPRVEVGSAFLVREPQGQDWLREYSMFDFGSYLVVQPALTSATAEINFFTYPSPVLDLDGATPANGQFSGQLYGATNEVEASLSPVGAPVPFLDGAGAGFIRSASVKLSGVIGGQTVFLQLRVWENCLGDTYEQAVVNGSASGRSSVFSAIAHAPIEDGKPGLPPPNANSFPSFSVSLGEDVPMRVARIRHRGSGAEICFATQPGHAYCLQKSVNHQEWTTLPGTEQIVGTGRAAKVTDPVATQGFYRLCRVQQTAR